MYDVNVGDPPGEAVNPADDVCVFEQDRAGGWLDCEMVGDVLAFRCADNGAFERVASVISLTAISLLRSASLLRMASSAACLMRSAGVSSSAVSSGAAIDRLSGQVYVVVEGEGSETDEDGVEGKGTTGDDAVTAGDGPEFAAG